MKILSAEQIRQVDQYTIKNEPISSLDLMERAATSFVDWFVERFSPKCRVTVVCGTGNNGGDGLVIARLLNQKNYQVEVFVIRKARSASDDFQANEGRLSNMLTIINIEKENEIPGFQNSDVIIDAIFGSGLSRPVEGLFGKVIEAINNCHKTKIAVDIASGLFADEHTVSGTIVNADYTVSFQLPKQAFLMPENAPYVGDWHVTDIGLMQEAIDTQQSQNYMLTDKMVAEMLRPRKKFSHKGTYGRTLIMAGSYGKMGAAVLCARAAMRTGTGLLTMNIPRCGYAIMQSAVPEAMVINDEGDHYLTSYPDLSEYDAVGIGPGIGQEQETMYSLMQAVQTFAKPLVIDADGLNIISAHREILHILPANTILTPHPGEFTRLAGKWKDDFDRLLIQRNFSKEHGVIVILKGAHTSISLPNGQVFFNSTGNPGMATGGTGDVLTGILTSLLGQQYSPEEAAKIGTYLHGLAGDLAAEMIGQQGLIASDVIDFIPDAYQHLI